MVGFATSTTNIIKRFHYIEYPLVKHMNSNMLASLNNQFYFSDVVIFPIEINLTPLTDIMSDASELIDQIGMMAGFVKEAHPFSSNKKQQQD